MPDGQSNSAPTPPLSDERPWPSRNERGYEIPEQPYGTLHRKKVICVGAGISGICLAHTISTRGENVDLTIYEVASGSVDRSTRHLRLPFGNKLSADEIYLLVDNVERYGGTWFW